MKLINISNRKVLSNNCKIATHLSDKYLGLLKPENPRCLIFFTRFGLHTFFLSEPIDILVLDSNWKVVIVRQCLKPFRFFFYPLKYFTVIEMSSGVIKKSQTNIGDKIFLA